MRAKREVHRLSSHVWDDPSTQNLFLFLFHLRASPLSASTLKTIVGISISIQFRTVVANSNNFQTHPVCNLLSTNEIKSVFNLIDGIEISEVHYDRTHRIGQGKTNGNGEVERQMIVKFTSWRSRRKIYKTRKSLNNYRVYLDLTKRRFDLLNSR